MGGLESDIMMSETPIDQRSEGAMSRDVISKHSTTSEQKDEKKPKSPTAAQIVPKSPPVAQIVHKSPPAAQIIPKSPPAPPQMARRGTSLVQLQKKPPHVDLGDDDINDFDREEFDKQFEKDFAQMQPEAAARKLFSKVFDSRRPPAQEPQLVQEPVRPQVVQEPARPQLVQQQLDAQDITKVKQRQAPSRVTISQQSEVPVPRVQPVQSEVSRVQPVQSEVSRVQPVQSEIPQVHMKTHPQQNPVQQQAKSSVNMNELLDIVKTKGIGELATASVGVLAFGGFAIHKYTLMFGFFLIFVVVAMFFWIKHTEEEEEAEKKQELKQKPKQHPQMSDKCSVEGGVCVKPQSQ